MSLKMKFSKSDVEELDLPDFLINVWSYADYLTDPIINQYQKWCVELAEDRWQPQFLNFEYVIKNLKIMNKKFYDFGRICSVDKKIIYRVIHKW